jgi:predicted RecB family nuclease
MERICEAGHRFVKTSDCPICPHCEAARKPESGLLNLVAAPARRALERAGIYTVQDLSRWTEAELLQLHGFGPSSLPKLREAMQVEGITWKD